MYGQMTAGCWIYIGSQGILQGTYETFAAAARKHFGGTCAGRWMLTGGLGGMGGAQPLAATMTGAAMLAVEVRPDAHRAAPANRLLRPHDQLARRSARWIERGVPPAKPSGFRRPAGQLRRGAAGTRPPRRGARSA